MQVISRRAFNLIVECEVTSRAVYERDYQRPTWPGGSSGITVGIGYDLGYVGVEHLHQDWDGRLADTMIRVMTRCLGLTGDVAKNTLPGVRNAISVPWDAALAVFSEKNMPEWTNRVCTTLPGAEKLPPDCLGALVSLAYNRGDAFDADGDRYREMRNIRHWIAIGDLARIPDEFRSMKRLWPTVRGLRDRRDREAQLFADGLASKVNQPVMPPDAPKAIPPTPPDVPPVMDEPMSISPMWGTVSAIFKAVASILLNNRK